MPVTLELTDDQALVLFHLVVQRSGEAPRIPTEHPAEPEVLKLVEKRLASQLLAPFTKDYVARLHRARDRLVSQE